MDRDIREYSVRVLHLNGMYVSKENERRRKSKHLLRQSYGRTLKNVEGNHDENQETCPKQVIPTDYTF